LQVLIHLRERKKITSSCHVRGVMNIRFLHTSQYTLWNPQVWFHPAAYPMPRVPLPRFHGGHASQPYPIPTRGAAHEPVGVVPRAPPLSSRGFGAGRGNAGASIGSLLPHQQGTQQPIGNIVSFFNFHASEKPSSQPSMPFQGPGRSFRDGFSMCGMSQ
ncbi:hypothetical protein UlMin_004844, partial [Ulmus minor]